MKDKMTLVVFVLLASLLSGCATTHEGNLAGKVGALGGGLVGALVGHNSSAGAGEGAAVGALAGLIGGQAYGDYFGGKHEKLEREALARQSVVTMYNNASDAYTSCVNNARVQNRNEEYCKAIKTAAGLDTSPGPSPKDGKSIDEALEAYQNCAAEARRKGRDKQVCRGILYAAGIAQPPETSTGRSRANESFFR